MQIFNDPDLGQIVIKPHAKAKRIIARQRNGFIQLTVPLRFGLKDLPPSWSSLKPKLLQLRKTPPGIFSEGDTFSTFSSTAKIMRSPLIDEKFRVSVKNGELLVLVPESTDFANIAAQQKIKALLISALKWEAKKILPEKTSALAQKNGLSYSEVRISSATTRWGSCSDKRVISLSLYLMLLPERLIDYVILHELAHTVEMNHSPKFWKLLDRLCGCDSKKIGTELRSYNSEILGMLTR